MKTKQILVYGFITVILVLAFTACSKSGGGSSGGGGKSLNSATELMEYLNKQPANSPDQPIKVAIKANDMMFKEIVGVIKGANKYVSIDFSGTDLSMIPEAAFSWCETLTGITLPNSVTVIGGGAFQWCTSLASTTIPASVTKFGSFAFEGWTASQSINIQGKANREATIAAGWEEIWDKGCEAQINYGQ